MKHDRSMIALLIGIFGIPFLLSLMFYLIGLSQEHILNWDGFRTRLWVGPYFAVGAIVCVIACSLSLYWLRTDKKNHGDQDLSKPRHAERITHTVTIDDARWEKFLALGGAEWLDAAVDEA